MFKSIKSRFILSCVTSLLFISLIFILFNSPVQISNTQVNIYIFVTLASVFNTGIQAQKYLQSKGITIK
ncbi:hypothetical protein CD33_06470 [Ureibacillus sinduriensis BLB-1 = JCM 15800]|uniref:Uncharacterized protein n=1 Tax=Ureibacillus sinduriensis BLB-1 = JCM 15800 TaxID=1384057 RepID=A0A0A3HZ18_9BACL|nr:hypothetical protein CD33_06470 [Ureibacillus sinduriensis BLB-1 = JCM 15800]